MKYIESGTNKDTRQSYVTIKHNGKFYDGFAKCHPEDYFSEFTGCRYAQERAEIKALKDEWRKKKASCEECRKFVKSVTQYKDFDKNSPIAKIMYRQLHRRIKNVNKLGDIISKRELNLRIAIKHQEKIENKLVKNNKTPL